MTEAAAYHGALFAAAARSDDFRRVLATTANTQLVIMTIQPGSEIGAEVHPDIDQILIAYQGAGRSVVDGVEAPFVAGDVVVVPQGADHNFINDGSQPLRIITVYGPPEHAPGTVHRTKEEADLAEAHHHR